jgi:O-methyltransferase
MRAKDEVMKLYLDLMKNALTYYIWGEDYQPFTTNQLSPVKRFVYQNLIKFLNGRKILLVRKLPYNPTVREYGKDHPVLAHTMIGLKRLSNIQFCVEDVIANNVPGDLIETGVWRGGAVIFMRALLKAYGIADKKVWVADSFEGLPNPNPEKYPADRGMSLHHMSHLAVSLDQVEANFKSYDLLDDQVIFLKGWFKDTLPSAPISKLSVMRLDGDMYESTMDALISLYPKLSIGGFIIVDDYMNIAACRAAVDDYRTTNNITEEIQKVDWSAIYWKKGK